MRPTGIGGIKGPARAASASRLRSLRLGVGGVYIVFAGLFVGRPFGFGSKKGGVVSESKSTSSLCLRAAAEGLSRQKAAVSSSNGWENLEPVDLLVGFAVFVGFMCA